MCVIHCKSPSNGVMVPDFAGGKPSPLWNAAKKPCPELQSGPCCVPRRCLFPARKGSCRKTGGFTPIFWRTKMRKSCFYREWCFQWKILDGNDLSNGTWCFHRFSIFETGWKWAPFRACIQQKNTEQHRAIDAYWSTTRAAAFFSCSALARIFIQRTRLLENGAGGSNILMMIMMVIHHYSLLSGMLQ